MIESPLPYVSHKTAPFRAPVLRGNRSSGVQPISVNRVLVSCSGVIGNSLILVCHTERRPQSPCSMWEQELNRYPLCPHTQLYTYLNDTGLLAAGQSGFRKNHSTQTSLHKLLENFYSDIENGKIIGMLALDLRKAFDTVNHKIILDKLKHYGISGICLNWFCSYLESRTQMACINGSVSDPLIITTGIPQGSILGPLLFTIYMNDVPKCLQHCTTNMYADETAMCVSTWSSPLIKT